MEGITNNDTHSKVYNGRNYT